MNLENLQSFLEILDMNRFATIVLIIFMSIICFMLWRSGKLIDAVNGVSKLVSGKKFITTVNDFSEILPPHNQHFVCSETWTANMDLAVSDCTELKIPLINMLKHHQTLKKAMTLNLAPVRNLTPQAVRALEMFVRSALSENYHSVIIKIIFPKNGVYPTIDKFYDWVLDRIDESPIKNMSLLRDRYEDEKTNGNGV